jgi:hypothetical protein
MATPSDAAATRAILARPLDLFTSMLLSWAAPKRDAADYSLGYLRLIGPDHNGRAGRQVLDDLKGCECSHNLGTCA